MHKTTKKSEKDINGLGGWLTLVGLGLIFSVVTLIIAIFSNGFDFSSYTKDFQSFVRFEAFMNLSFFVATIYIIFLFFKRKKEFAKFYIWYLIFGVILYGIYWAWFNDVISGYEMTEEIIATKDGVNTDFGRTIFSTLVWGSYMMISERVKQTFIK